MTPAELSRAVTEVLEGRYGGAAALATVIERSGSAPQILGAKLLLRDDGEIFGTVGGGAIEARVIEACREVLASQSATRVRANLVRDLGMCCGGTMEVFVEPLLAPCRLVVIGGGHVAQALAPMAAQLDFAVEVLDDREDLLAHPAFAGVRTRAYDADELADALPRLGARDYLVIVTRDHRRDEEALAHLIESPHAYLGMIGSKRKVIAILRRVLRRYDERDRPRPDLSRLRAPVGLALGGRSPAEIAVSICAELIAARRGGHGASMSIVEAFLAAPAGPSATPIPDDATG